MKITEENLKEVKTYLENNVVNKFIQHFSGWDDQIKNPKNLIFENKRENYQKEFPFNVSENYFTKVELERNLIRLRSSKPENLIATSDTDLEDHENIVIEVGDKFEIVENILILTITQNSLSKLLNKGNIIEILIFNSNLNDF